MKPSEAAGRVIELARKVRENYDAEYRRRYPNYPFLGPDDEPPQPPPEELKLQDFLATLPEETVYQLSLIMHLGRYDLGVENLAPYYDGSHQLVNSQFTQIPSHGGPPHAASHHLLAGRWLPEHHAGPGTRCRS